MSERTHDCEPTLTDADVIDFCRHGYLFYEAVVPDEINRRTLDFLDARPEGDPSEILEEDWFIEGVLLNPQAAGAVRSLLGRNFKLPTWMSNHRKVCPEEMRCGWHRDGGGIFTTEVNQLQVFYYPQDTPKEFGPTEIIPSSHFIQGSRRFMKHVGRVRKGFSTASPAGTIFVTHYPILHRKTPATATGVRHMLKYNYWRKTSPVRDWVTDPNQDIGSVDFRPETSFHELHWSAIPPARMYTWLCGLSDAFDFKGGAEWPITVGQFPSHPQEGFPVELERRSE